MSFCGVVTTRSAAAPCFSATAKYMAVIGAAMPLIVSDTLTRSSGMPANASSMSASVSMAMPTRPTSPSARVSSESRPSCVGRSNATFSASCPCAIKYLNRAFVSAGVPKPMYWRIVQSRSRYMCLWMPRVYGNSPGRPRSAAGSRAARSSGPYTGFTGMAACRVTSRMLPPRRDARPAGPAPSVLRCLQELPEERQDLRRALLGRRVTAVGQLDDLRPLEHRAPAGQEPSEGRVLHAPQQQGRDPGDALAPLPERVVPRARAQHLARVDPRGVPVGGAKVVPLHLARVPCPGGDGMPEHHADREGEPLVEYTPQPT